MKWILTLALCVVLGTLATPALGVQFIADGSSAGTLERSIAHEMRRETIGTKVLDGHPTTLFQITAKEGSMTWSTIKWWAEDWQVPLRVARKDGAWMVEYKDVKLRSYLSALFEIPLHYRPIEPRLSRDEQSSEIIFPQFVIQPCAADLENFGGFHPVPPAVGQRFDDAGLFCMLLRALRY